MIHGVEKGDQKIIRITTEGIRAQNSFYIYKTKILIKLNDYSRKNIQKDLVYDSFFLQYLKD